MDAHDFDQALRERGLSSSDAARLLGCSRSYISYLRSGQRRITPTRADSITLRLMRYDKEQTDG